VAFTRRWDKANAILLGPTVGLWVIHPNIVKPLCPIGATKTELSLADKQLEEVTSLQIELVIIADY